LTIWHPPEQPFLKLNYDEASKNNPGIAGFGGVFHNSMGSILWIYYGNLGHTTNNVAELQALAKGLIIAKKKQLLAPSSRGRLQCCHPSLLKVAAGL